MPESIPDASSETDTRSPQRTTSPGQDGRQIDADAFLSVLSDEHARAILRTISDAPLAAAEIADRLDISRSTVYRRLNRLETAGIVDSSMSYRSDGNHRQQFHLTLERATLSFDDGAVIVDEAQRSPD